MSEGEGPESPFRDESIDEIFALISSLSALMHEETQALGLGVRPQALAELAAAKARLVGSLETHLARLTRESPDWIAGLDAPLRETARAAVGELRAASLENAAVLERQMELSAEMLGAISAEARRLSGGRAYAYGASGTLARADLPTPISLNGEF